MSQLGSTSRCASLHCPTERQRSVQATYDLSATASITQAIVIIVWISAVLGVLGTVALIVRQNLSAANVYYLEHDGVIISNLVVCAVLMLFMTVVSVLFTWQLVRVAVCLPKGIRYVAFNAEQITGCSVAMVLCTLQHRWWRHLGIRHIILTLLLLIALWVSLIFNIIPNALVVSSKCWYVVMHAFGLSCGKPERCTVCRWNTYSGQKAYRLPIQYMSVVRNMAHNTVLVACINH